MLGPPTAVLGQGILGLMVLGLSDPSSQTSPRPIIGKANILNTTTTTIAGKSYVFKGHTITGKGSISNPYYPGSFSFGYNDQIPIKLVTASYAPISSTITFTSASKKSRGGAGMLGALSTKRATGPGGWDLSYFARKTLNQQNTLASRATVKTVSLT